jgi:hypothetical protein
MMNVRKWTQTLSILALLSIVLVKFQNCAATKPGEDYATNNDGEVRIIDQWSSANKIEFLSPSFLVENTVQSIVVPGLCVGAPKGQRLAWQLLDQAGSIIVESGTTECVMGNFQLSLSNLAFANCGSRLELKAQKENSSEPPAVTILRPFCES